MHYKRQPDGWIIWYRDDGTELIRVHLPGDITYRELDDFVEHLKRAIKQRDQGPN